MFLEFHCRMRADRRQTCSSIDQTDRDGRGRLAELFSPSKGMYDSVGRHAFRLASTLPPTTTAGANALTSSGGPVSVASDVGQVQAGFSDKLLHH